MEEIQKDIDKQKEKAIVGCLTSILFPDEITELNTLLPSFVGIVSSVVKDHEHHRVKILSIAEKIPYWSPYHLELNINYELDSPPYIKGWPYKYSITVVAEDTTIFCGTPPIHSLKEAVNIFILMGHNLRRLHNYVLLNPSDAFSQWPDKMLQFLKTQPTS
jgi:hypothetical protein